MLVIVTFSFTYTFSFFNSLVGAFQFLSQHKKIGIEELIRIINHACPFYSHFGIQRLLALTSCKTNVATNWVLLDPNFCHLILFVKLKCNRYCNFYYFICMYINFNFYPYNCLYFEILFKIF